MKKNRKLWAMLCLLLVARLLCAQDSARGKALNDPLLDKLIGDWNVERKFGNGRTAKNVVHGQWVLQHQFVELHYRDATSSENYEAIVLIGYDDIANHYLCHWADKFGGSYSVDGFAPRDEASNAIEFKFEFHDGPLTNRFAFDSKSGLWTSTIRQAEKGDWKLFCEDTFTRTTRADDRQ